MSHIFILISILIVEDRNKIFQMNTYQQESNKILLNVWPRWLDKRSASLYLSCSIKTIDRLINSGKLPYSQINGGHRKIDIRKIDELLEKNSITICKSSRIDKYEI